MIQTALQASTSGRFSIHCFHGIKPLIRSDFIIDPTFMKEVHYRVSKGAEGR